MNNRKNHPALIPLTTFSALVFCGFARCEPAADSAMRAAQGKVPDLPERPNILLVVVDDLNDEVGFLDDPHAMTPNMDRLASQSAVFVNAHVQAPICGPSRNSFLTGKYPHNTGLYGLDPLFRDVPELSTLTSLPQHFREHGYRSVGVGKIYHTKRDELSFDNPNPGWFGAFGPFPDKEINLDPDLPVTKYYDWGPFLEETETADYKVAQYACRQIEEFTASKTPWFLSVGFFRPHCPYFAPQKWFDLHPVADIPPAVDESEDLKDIPPYGLKLVGYNAQQKFDQWLKKSDKTASFLQAYRACVSFADHCMGMVLDALKASGLENNTIVVLLGDHGLQNGAKNLWYKRTLWEKTTRVPLVIKVPGQPARRITAPAGLIDIYPTLCELAGLPVPDGLDGLSLTGLIEGRPGAEQRPPALTSHGPGNFSLRDERWRYTRYADGSEELYDHTNDPEERRNLATNAEYKDAIARLKPFVPEESKPFAPGSKGMDSPQFPGK
ncbi:MAG: sulfatase [Chthoniobacterales bacterium]